MSETIISGPLGYRLMIGAKSKIKSDSFSLNPIQESKWRRWIPFKADWKYWKMILFCPKFSFQDIYADMVQIS